MLREDNIMLETLSVWSIMDRSISLVVVIFLVCGGVVYGLISHYTTKKATVYETTDELVDSFDATLWYGSWQYLWNHADDIPDVQFLQELYLLLLDAVSEYYACADLETKHLDEIMREKALDHDTKQHIAIVYTALFTTQGVDLTQKHAYLDAIYYHVLQWFPLDDKPDT